MPTDTISCPYCNAYVTVPEARSPGQRVLCPRCGESFSYRQPTEGEPERPTSIATASGSPAADQLARSVMRRPSNRAMAAAVLGLMLLMALISLMVGLKTVPFRRSHDPLDPLAFLPADTNVIGLVRVQQALQEVAGRQLLGQLYLGAPGADLGLLEEWTGLRRDDIQTAVLGLHVGSDFIPRLTIIVQTQVPYDEKTLPASLKEAERIERGPRTLYRVPLRRLGLSATLWYASDSILVACLSPKDFDSVPETPASGMAQFPAPLQAYIAERIAPSAQAWIIGHAEHWDDTIAFLTLSGLTPGYPDLFGDLRTWGITLQFDREVKISGACEMKSERAARALAAYVSMRYSQRGGSLATRVSAATGIAAEPASSLGAALILTDAGQNPVQVGPGAWVSFQLLTTPSAILETLRGSSPGVPGLLGR
jgi:hypothetical protein